MREIQTVKKSQLPDTMTAALVRDQKLVPETVPLPVLKNGEVLVRVHAAGVNRPDLLQRRGLYPPPAGVTDIPGLEIAGEIAAVASGVRGIKAGQKICALVAGGGYAEYVAVHETNALPVPAGFTFSEAAAIPETFFTVWHNVFQRGGLKAGESFLVHGGSSGIGTAAIQLGAAFGARVLATAGSAEKCEACLKLGAARAINYREEDFVRVAREETDGKGVDVILDMVGGDYVSRNYAAAAVEGRIVQIATLGGAKASVDIARLMVKRLTHTGSTLRPRSVAFKAEIAAALEAKVWPLLADRKIAPVMDMIFPLKEAWRAHERMEEGDHIGKIVLDVL